MQITTRDDHRLVLQLTPEEAEDLYYQLEAVLKDSFANPSSQFIIRLVAPNLWDEHHRQRRQRQ